MDTPKRRWPWMRIALVTSVAVNLAIAGVVVGALLGGGRDGGAPRPSALGLGPFAEALSDEDRRAIMQDFRQEAGSFRENRAALRADFNRLLAALRADPYDPGTVRQIIDAQDRKLGERLDLGRRLLVDRLDAMTPEARAAYATRLEDSLQRRVMRRRERERDRD